ncbi:nuclear transport factor 2 family protein [uncultured Croceitalea sp.]|uniref:nuclear transport factor 2 family protein n=1 Tax=uncultured Croceitalea sp. TaxID=1798908 RepID=UPI0033063B51
MKVNFFLILLFLSSTLLLGQESEKQLINDVLDSWHKAAAEANFEAYFDKMTKDGVFLGTDATENWQNQEFKDYSKPHFDKGRAWSFTAVERNIYLAETEHFAWFDELLDTQMKLCRGSGVLQKVNGTWKIAHYVLSIAVPNENVTELISIKKESDSILTKKLKAAY